MQIVGRNKEIAELEHITSSGVAEFAVVYGRRRVGKTFLVNEFYENDFTFKVTGLAKKDKKLQLKNFADALTQYGNAAYPVPSTWVEAFSSLRFLLENKKSEGRQVVFIDELPWMDTQKSNLLPALEHFWNDWGCTQSNLLLIVCGSATSWITKKLIRNKGGLHNRLTRKIYVRPFNLYETKEYFKYRKLDISDKDILECYMIMGGIPYYLSMLERGKSLAQNIDEMFFRRKGKLDGEFENLYASLFDNSEQYIKVVTALSKKNKGLSREEIIKATALSDGGALSEVLSDLDNCDLIRRYQGFGKDERGALYQLTDFYTFFYFKFIKKYGTSEKPFWAYQINTPVHNAWSGYAFEQLCLYHYNQIEKSLGINGILTKAAAWTAKPDDSQTPPLKGAQIDLIISRSDHIVNVCEMKFTDEEFSMTARYREEINNKILRFRRDCKIRYPIHPVLVTTYGLKHNEHSDIFQNVVVQKDLFAEN